MKKFKIVFSIFMLLIAAVGISARAEALPILSQDRIVELKAMQPETAPTEWNVGHNSSETLLNADAQQTTRAEIATLGGIFPRDNPFQTEIRENTVDFIREDLANDDNRGARKIYHTYSALLSLDGHIRKIWRW